MTNNRPASFQQYWNVAVMTAKDAQQTKLPRLYFGQGDPATRSGSPNAIVDRAGYYQAEAMKMRDLGGPRGGERYAAIALASAAVASATASRSRSSGLTRKPSMPAARQASRSSAKALAVSATIGVRARRLGLRGADAPRRLDAVDARHVHVHQHEVVRRRRPRAPTARRRPRRRRWSRWSGDDRASPAASAPAAR